MFSPALFQVDLIRNSRRPRHFVIRAAFAAAVLLVMASIYYEKFRYGASGGRTATAEFAATSLIGFAWMQTICVLLITPGLTANILSEERQRGTIDYLLSSELSSGEIVLGKLAARLTYLLQFLLVGLPILALLQLLGGIEMLDLIQVFVIGLSTMIVTACVALVLSLYHPRTAGAISATYGVVLAAVVGPLFAYWLIGSVLHNSWILSSWMQAWSEVVYWSLLAWNPLVAISPNQAFRSAVGLHDGWMSLPHTLSMVGYHTAISLACLAWAIGQLRAVATGSSHPPRPQTATATANPSATTKATNDLRASATSQATTPRHKRGFQLSDNVRSNPVLWKELRMASRPRARTWQAWTFAVFAPAAWMLLATVVYIMDWNEYLSNYWTSSLFYTNHQSYVPSDFAKFTILGSSVLGMLACLLVGIRGANSITYEKERGTWATLLSTPLSGTQILAAKFWGSLWGAREPILLTIAMFLMLIVRDGRFLVSVPLVALTWAASLAFCSALGLYFSLTSANSTRAIGWTVGILAALIGGYLALFIILFLPRGPDDTVIVLGGWIPFLMMLASMSGFSLFTTDPYMPFIQAYIGGMILYTLATGGLITLARRQFDRHSGRSVCRDG